MNSPFNPSNTRSAADGAVLVASGALDGVARTAGPAMQAVAHGVDDVRNHAAPALRELASGAEDLALGRLRAARDQALHLRDTGADYARGHPVQSLLLAAAAGAGLMVLLGLLNGRNRSR